MSASLRHAFYATAKEEQHAAFREQQRQVRVRPPVVPRSHGRVLLAIRQDQ